MNIFLKRTSSQPVKGKKINHLYWFVTVVIPIGALIATFIWAFYTLSQVPNFQQDVEQEPSYSVDTVPQAVYSAEVVVTSVAESYGVPSGAMLRLSDYLQHPRFEGVGLFAIKPEHIGWIQDYVLLDTSIDLTEDIQNSHIAAFLLRRFMDAGYSDEEAFLIYVYGFRAIHERELYQDFLTSVFPDEG